MEAAVPEVEITDHADRARGRRPDGERRPVAALVIADVRTEPVVQLLVAALADQVLIELADGGREGVLILDRELRIGAVVDLERVVLRQLHSRHPALEHAPGMDQLQLAVRAPVETDGDRARRRAQRAHDDAVSVGMGAEHGVRLRVLAANERVEFTSDHRHTESSSRLIPATGIGSQSGRLSSSYWSS